MASARQIAANRLNAQKSTGPRTGAGKQRSRRNAFRHGLTAESVVTVLEDEAAYKTFESKILADYAAETAIERALVARLASLLWRLRRATAIESGLFQIQGQILHDRQNHNDPNDPLRVFYKLLKYPHLTSESGNQAADQTAISEPKRSAHPIDPIEMAVCFLRLENFNTGKLDLVGRYETRLWRQLAQAIILLNLMRRGVSPRHSWREQALKANQFSAWRWKDLT
jgi:hypothetical protein